MPQLQMQGITKRFGDEVAVRNLSLDVDEGEFKALLGPSGCGKTTTLRSVAGLETPDEGKISIDGRPVFDAEDGINVPPEERDIGMVFQSYAVWPHMTVKKNVLFPLEVQKVQTEERESRVDEILNVVGLGDHIDDLATNLSGGQQQRVAIARALVVEPKILLFDEPLASLDAKLRREMRIEIKRICNDFDITVLYVTHAQDEAMFLADEIAVMNDGQIVEVGEPTSLHENPKELFAMEFMGHTNSLPCEVKSLNGSSVGTVETPIGEVSVRGIPESLRENSKARLTFRPKFVDIDDSTGDAGTNTFDGVLEMIAPTRDFTEYEIDVGGQKITAKTATPKTVKRGDNLRISIEPDVIKVWDSP